MSMDKKIEVKGLNKRHITLSVVSGAFVMLFLFQLFWGDKSNEMKVHKEKVIIGKVIKDHFKDYIAINGVVEPIKTVVLDAIEGGIVEEILVEEGNKVDLGESILKLKNTNLRIDIMNREAMLAEQINNLRNTHLQMEQHNLDIRQQILELDYLVSQESKKYEKQSVLYEKGLLALDKYEEVRDKYNYLMTRKKLLLESYKQDSLYRKNQIQQLNGSVNRMQENLKLVRDKEKHLKITAPIYGRLTMLNAEIGELKSSGEHIGQISIIDSFKLSAEIDEYFISRIYIGLKARIDYKEVEYMLKIKKIYPEVQGGRFTIDLVFLNKHLPNTRIGQTFNIDLELGESTSALLIPRGTFYQSTGGQFVYVIGGNGKIAVKRKIKLGRQNPEYYEVLEGLSLNDEIIISDYNAFLHMDKLIFE